MIQRIKDKVLILLLVMAAIVLISENVTAVHVSAILASVIMATVDELVDRRWLPYVFTAFVVLSTIYSPLFIMLIPMLVYILFSKSEYYEYITAIVLVVLGLFKSDTILSGTLLMSLSLVSGYLAYHSAYYERMINRSTVLFDEARREAIESSRKRRELREKADSEIYTERLKERNRIAREIHDNVGHMLTRAVVQMQAILVVNKDETIKPYLESVNTTINEAMTNIRRSVHELHDDSIDLSIGINELATSLKDRFEVNVSTSLDSPVPNEIKLQILGIIKEGITNISKHSNGNQAIIEVVENVTFWRIKIFDNGKSREMELSSNSDFAALGGDSGIGLTNINSRASGLKGRVNITGGNSGFTIIATIPKQNK